MPIQLVRRPKSPYWIIRGTLRGIRIEESTGTDNKKIAEEIRAKRESEILSQSIYGRRATASFAEAALSYLENGGNKRFLDKVIAYFGTRPLAKIDQDAIDQGARKTYPGTSGATRNRQFYTPTSAVLKHAAKRGWCSPIIRERPEKPPGRIRWITPDEADRLIAACNRSITPLVVFLPRASAKLCGLTGATSILRAVMSSFRSTRATAAVPRTTKRAVFRCIRGSAPRSPIFRIGSGRFFVASMACPTSACARARRRRATASERLSRVPASGPVSRISRCMIAATRGRPGTTPRTAICSRCKSSAAGKRSRW
jgi:hypothetical protein